MPLRRTFGIGELENMQFDFYQSYMSQQPQMPVSGLSTLGQIQDPLWNSRPPDSHLQFQDNIPHGSMESSSDEGSPFLSHSDLNMHQPQFPASALDAHPNYLHNYDASTSVNAIPVYHHNALPTSYIYTHDSGPVYPQIEAGPSQAINTNVLLCPPPDFINSNNANQQIVQANCAGNIPRYDSSNSDNSATEEPVRQKKKRKTDLNSEANVRIEEQGESGKKRYSCLQPGCAFSCDRISAMNRHHHDDAPKIKKKDLKFFCSAHSCPCGKNKGFGRNDIMMRHARNAFKSAGLPLPPSLQLQRQGKK